MSTRLEVDFLVVGAGVIGLAAAARLARRGSVVVVERHEGFGRETSSRNSEVIHSGIHYPTGSRKTSACLDGRKRLYAYAEHHGIPYRRTGKIVVAVAEDEEATLARLEAHSREVGVPCEPLSGSEVSAKEPRVRARAGLLFPQTGIVDSHALMASLEREAVDGGASLAYRHRVTGMERAGDRWKVSLDAPDGTLAIRAGGVINAAGFAAAELSNRALGTDRYEHRACRGRYLVLPAGFRGAFRHLVYPLPVKDGIGVHVTFDLEGTARLGPDVEWIDGSDAASFHTVDWESLKAPFARAVAGYLPGVRVGDLAPGLVGVRPKLFVGKKAHPDFLVECANGWAHALGVESPGLTSCLSLAEELISVLP